MGLANRLVVAKGTEALRDRLAAASRDGVAHVVVDAVANDDLHIIAEACHDMTLLTGGSAVAMPLPDIWIRQGSWRDPPSQVHHAEEGPAIILSGSCSAMTNRQVAAYLQRAAGLQLDPLDLAEEVRRGFEWLAAQALMRTPIIYATAAPDEVARRRTSSAPNARARWSRRRLPLAPSKRAILASGVSSSRAARPRARSPKLWKSGSSRSAPKSRRCALVLCPNRGARCRDHAEIRAISAAKTFSPRRWRSGRVTEEARLREQICMLAKSMFERGLTHGSTGNISARTSDGGLLVSPTGTSFGRLDPAD